MTISLYKKEELQALLKVAAKAGIFVISDEVYSEIVYDKNQFFSCGELAEQMLVKAALKILPRWRNRSSVNGRLLLR